MKATHANEVKKFEDIPNVGPRIADDFRALKVSEPAGLAREDAYDLYQRLCRLTSSRQDPCVLDTFMAAVDFMQGAEARPWWSYTSARKAQYPDL